MYPQNGTIYGGPRQLPWPPAHFFRSVAEVWTTWRATRSPKPRCSTRAARRRRPPSSVPRKGMMGSNMTWKRMGTGAFGSTRSLGEWFEFEKSRKVWSFEDDMELNPWNRVGFENGQVLIVPWFRWPPGGGSHWGSVDGSTRQVGMINVPRQRFGWFGWLPVIEWLQWSSAGKSQFYQFSSDMIQKWWVFHFQSAGNPHLFAGKWSRHGACPTSNQAQRFGIEDSEDHRS